MEQTECAGGAFFLVRHAGQSGNNDVFTALLSPNHAEGNPNKTISDENGERDPRIFPMRTSTRLLFSPRGSIHRISFPLLILDTKIHQCCHQHRLGSRDAKFSLHYFFRGRAKKVVLLFLVEEHLCCSRGLKGEGGHVEEAV